MITTMTPCNNCHHGIESHSPQSGGCCWCTCQEGPSYRTDKKFRERLKEAEKVINASRKIVKWLDQITQEEADFIAALKDYDKVKEA